MSTKKTNLLIFSRNGDVYRELIRPHNLPGLAPYFRVENCPGSP